MQAAVGQLAAASITLQAPAKQRCGGHGAIMHALPDFACIDGSGLEQALVRKA